MANIIIDNTLQGWLKKGILEFYRQNPGSQDLNILISTMRQDLVDEGRLRQHSKGEFVVREGEVE